MKTAKLQPSRTPGTKSRARAKGKGALANAALQLGQRSLASGSLSLDRGILASALPSMIRRMPATPTPNRTGPDLCTRGRAAIFVLLLLLAAGVAAYALVERRDSHDDANEGFPSVLLEFTPVETPELGNTQIQAAFRATRELEGVDVLAKNYKVQPRDVGENRELMLLLRGNGEKKIDIAGEFDPASFNRVIVRFLAFTQEAIQIVFLRDGKEVRRSNTQVTSSSPDPQSLVFEMPETRNIALPFDQIRVLVEGLSKPSALFSIDLIKRPMSAWLPAPEAPASVEIGIESRTAMGLSSEHPLITETVLPPGARLAFGYGQPSKLWHRKQGKSRVRVRAIQGELEETREFTLKPAKGLQTAWKSVGLPLKGFADRRTRFEFEFLVEGDCEGLCALASPIVYSPGLKPPTVLLITSDTHRADHLGKSGGRFQLETPALDALADSGAFFEQAYSSTNVTNPSHIALMTATHPRDTEIINNHVQLSDSAQTLAECFREAGYATYASVCAKHLGHTTSGLGQGFDRMIRPWRPFTDAEVAIDRLSEWISDARGRPLFIWLHVFDAHHPYGPPKQFDRRYWDDERDPFDPSLPLVELPNGVALETIFPPDLHELRDLEFPKAQYKAEITYLDAQLSRVFDWPRISEALIAMTADHGESFGEHGVYYDHAGAYPQNLHVPLILAGPTVQAGLRSEFPVQQIDIGRTLLDLSGMTEIEFPGVNLLEVIESTSEPQPQFTISAHGFDASITHQRLHVVLHLRDGQSTALRTYKRCHTELYDLDQDPECAVDLWEHPEYRERGKQLRRRLVNWLARAKSTGWAIEGTLTAETLAELEGLGYAASGSKQESKDWFVDCATDDQ